MNPSSGARPPSAPYIARRRPLSRRRFLQGAGVALGLPWLEGMLPSFVRAAEPDSPFAPGAKPRRLFGICNNLGLLGDQFFPTGSGRNYAPSPYLALLQEHRDDLTVFSGVSHPNVDGGHPADVCFLSAAAHPSSSSFRNTLSLDQLIAEKIGIQTRFPSLTLSVNTRSRSLSCTSMGVGIPPEDRPSVVFKQLFLQGNPAEVETQIRKLQTGESILDAVASQLRQLEGEVGGRDRDRLDQYFTSVRDLEHRLQVSRGWEHKPKPPVTAAPPVDLANPAQYFEKVTLMYDLARLAFETDSTRSIALMIDSVSSPVVDLPNIELSDGYHNLSHHGKSDEKRRQLKELDAQHMRVLAGLYQGLKNVKEGDESLLDRTMVLYGSNLGDANQHMCVNMPVLFAGGGFKHGQHLAFDTTLNYPLTNLYVSILQRLGLNQDRFVSSTGPMKGLEPT